MVEQDDMLKAYDQQFSLETEEKTETANCCGDFGSNCADVCSPCDSLDSSCDWFDYSFCCEYEDCFCYELYDECVSAICRLDHDDCVCLCCCCR